MSPVSCLGKQVLITSREVLDVMLTAPEDSAQDQACSRCSVNVNHDYFQFRDCFRSDQISHSVVSYSLRPHESQHSRPPCPSPTSGVHSDSRPITSWQIDRETGTLYFGGGSKITADGDCSHEIKRCLLLGRKVMTNLDSILKSRNILCQQRSI